MRHFLVFFFTTTVLASQPLRIEHLFNSPCLLKFGYFTFDSLYMFLGRALMWLPFRSNGWIDIQMMTNKIWI